MYYVFEYVRDLRGRDNVGCVSEYLKSSECARSMHGRVSVDSLGTIG